MSPGPIGSTHLAGLPRSIGHSVPAAPVGNARDFARILAFWLTIAIPLEGVAQTCATQSSSTPPPPLYSCIGGLCVDSISHWDSTNLTEDQWLESSAANYGSHLAQFGALTYSGEIVKGGGKLVVLQWQSQGNGLYTSILALVTPTEVCPPFTVSAVAAAERCEAAANIFLRSPDVSSLKALRDGDTQGCWVSIGASNEKLNVLDASVSSGNRSAALYLATNLKRMDGGKLADALIAMGQFADKDMAGFLDFARANVITSRESSDALTVLPPSSRGDLKTQLAAMEKRRAAVMLVTQQRLRRCKLAALADIDKIIRQIRASMTTGSKPEQ